MVRVHRGSLENQYVSVTQQRIVKERKKEKVMKSNDEMTVEKVIAIMHRRRETIAEDDPGAAELTKMMLDFIEAEELPHSVVGTPEFLQYVRRKSIAPTAKTILKWWTAIQKLQSSPGSVSRAEGQIIKLQNEVFSLLLVKETGTEATSKASEDVES